MDRNGQGARQILEQHRRDIEALDRRILHLVCERLELARSIGQLKQECGVPLRNFEVEEQVYRRFEKASEDLGLHSTLGRDLALLLIQKAVEEQATMRDSVYVGDQLKTLVVGGRGGMGSWMARFLAGQGHHVAIWDPAPGDSPYAEVEELAAGARSSDLIVLAVPMDATGDVLAELASSATTAVIAEMCSLKGHLHERIQGLRESGMRIVSFHPMFGPDVRMLSGRKVVFCNDADPEDLDFVRGLFAHTSADLVLIEAEEHDRRMAIVLGLTHFLNLAYARALSHSGVEARGMAEVAGVTFQKQLSTTAEVCNENPDLYYQIQALNGTTSDTAEWLAEAVREFQGAIGAGDQDSFVTMMKSCRELLSDLEPIS